MKLRWAAILLAAILAVLAEAGQQTGSTYNAVKTGGKHVLHDEDG
jgi:hypothetical protein